MKTEKQISKMKSELIILMANAKEEGDMRLHETFKQRYLSLVWVLDN